MERQRQDCTALVTAKGWTLAAAYVDNDVSAYSGKPRPQYAAMLEAVRTGRVDVIVAWHPDRLHRQPRELEEFITLVEERHVAVETVQAGEWDLSTPSGRLIARSLGTIARYESEHKSERVKRALQQRSASGKAHGRRAYGWTPAGKVDKREQRLVVELAERIVRGDSLRGIVADLNARGILSPSGKPWHKVMVRHLVTRDRNVGLLVRHGEVVGMGDWPPLLERALFEQVRAVLQDPTRKTSTGSAAKHLLSGIARCGVCGSPIRSGLNRQTLSYRCRDKSCVSRNQVEVDYLVAGAVVGRLGREDAVDLLAPERRDEVRAATTEAAGLRARLNSAADDYADGKIDAEQLERITARLRPKIDAAQTRARVVDDSPLLDGLIGAEDVQAAWNALPLTRQRAVVDLLVRVRILPVPTSDWGRQEPDPKLIEVSWRTT